MLSVPTPQAIIKRTLHVLARRRAAAAASARQLALEDRHQLARGVIDLLQIAIA
jgi:hypothetical protein